MITKNKKKQTVIKNIKTTYGVYILESNDIHFKDGEKLGEILDLLGFPCFYRSVADIEGFKKAIVEFNDLGFRYLHLSCHADVDGIQINGTDINNKELILLCKGQLRRKRIFLSACQTSNLRLATALIKNCHCQSIIGSPNDLPFVKAAMFWPAFYEKIKEIDSTAMNRVSISQVLKLCVDFFYIPINYYHESKKIDHLVRSKFRPNRESETLTVKMASKI